MNFSVCSTCFHTKEAALSLFIWLSRNVETTAVVFLNNINRLETKCICSKKGNEFKAFSGDIQTSNDSNICITFHNTD